MLWYQYSFRQYYPAQKSLFSHLHIFYILLHNEFDMSSDEDLLLKSCCNQPHATFLQLLNHIQQNLVFHLQKHKKKFFVFCEIHIHSIIRPKHRAILKSYLNIHYRKPWHIFSHLYPLVSTNFYLPYSLITHRIPYYL